jgi:hypothetical protein
VHVEVERVVMQALEKDPARRFASAGEMDSAWVRSASQDPSSLSVVGAHLDRHADDGWREFVPAGRTASTGNMEQIFVD